MLYRIRLPAKIPCHTYYCDWYAAYFCLAEKCWVKMSADAALSNWAEVINLFRHSLEGEKFSQCRQSRDLILNVNLVTATMSSNKHLNRITNWKLQCFPPLDASSTYSTSNTTCPSVWIFVNQMRETFVSKFVYLFIKAHPKQIVTAS